MHEEGFEFTFDIVQKNHENAQLLVECVVLGLTVDLLLEQDQEQSDQNRPKVLH